MFYLSSQFSGRGQDKGQRMLLPFGASITIGASSYGGRAIFENMVQNWNQESGRFAGSGLGTSHQIPPGQDDWQGVLLNGGGLGVVGHFNVLGQDIRQLDLVKVFDTIRHVRARSLHRNVLVAVKVDARRPMPARKQLRLDAIVPWQRHGPVLRRGPITAVLAVASTVVTSSTTAAAVTSAVSTVPRRFLPTSIVAVEGVAVIATPVPSVVVTLTISGRPAASATASATAAVLSIAVTIAISVI